MDGSCSSLAQQPGTPLTVGSSRGTSSYRGAPALDDAVLAPGCCPKRS